MNTFLENAKHLLLIQILNYFVPIALLPILLIRLGAGNFGLVMIAQAFTIYFIMIMDFGFPVSIIREVSQARNDKDLISRIYTNLIFLRFTIAILLLGVGILVIKILPVLNTDFLFYFLSILIIFPYVFINQWIFQGLEQVKYFFLSSLISKSVLFFLVLIFIRNDKDFTIFPLINLVSFLTLGFSSSLFIKKALGIKLKKEKFRNYCQGIKSLFLSGRYIFLSSIFTSLYTNSTTFILGNFFNPASVGYYSFCEKILRAITGVVQVFNIARFPLLVKEKNKTFDKIKTFIGYNFIYLIIACSLYLLGIAVIYFSEKMKIFNLGFLSIMKTMIPIIIPIIIGNFIVMVYIFRLNYEKKLLGILGGAGVFHFAVLLYLYIAEIKQIEIVVYLAIFTESIIAICVFILGFKIINNPKRHEKITFASYGVS